MTTRTTDTVEHQIGHRGEFRLRVAAGSIELSGVDTESVLVRDVNGQDLSRQFSIEATDGDLRLLQKEPILGLGRNRERAVELTVECPSDATVVIETASADLRVRDMTGEQRYRTTSGEVALTNVGGSVRLDTVSGDVDATLVGEATLEARSVSADLRIAGGRLPTVLLQTTSGDITLGSDLPGPGPYAIKTVSGDALVATGFNLRVESATVTGSVSTERPHRGESGRGRTVIHVGENGAPLSFQSISGDLRIDQSAAIETGREPAPAPVSNGPLNAPSDATSDVMSDERMAILRDLEAGRIDVAEATARLALVEGGD